MKKMTIAVLTAILATGCVSNDVKEGYTSQEDYELAQQWGNVKPNQQGIDLLRSKGVTSKAQFDAVVSEMKASGYPSDHSMHAIEEVLYYLTDKQVSQNQGISFLDARKQRIARQNSEQQREEAEAARQQQQYAKDFPYVLVISCEIGGQKLDIRACFTGKHRVRTELELRNGSEYRMYQIHDLHQAGEMTRDGLIIPLRSDFTVRAQNANKYIMTFAIYKTATKEQVYKKSASEFGVLAISN